MKWYSFVLYNLFKLWASDVNDALSKEIKVNEFRRSFNKTSQASTEQNYLDL